MVLVRSINAFCEISSAVLQTHALPCVHSFAVPKENVAYNKRQAHYMKRYLNQSTVLQQKGGREKNYPGKQPLVNFKTDVY